MRRPRSLLGLARARHASGSHAAANDAYRELLAVWSGRDFPEVAEARAHLAASH